MTERPAASPAAPAKTRTPQTSTTKTLSIAAGALLCIAALGACSTAEPQPQPSTSTTSAGSPSSPATPSESTPGTASAQATSTVGNLVGGFPSTLLPLFTGAQVKQSAFDKSKDPAAASLVATTTASSDDIVAFYTKAFTDQGFSLLPGDASGGLLSKDFVRSDGKETISLSITSENGLNTFTLGANVAQAALK